MKPDGEAADVSTASVGRPLPGSLRALSTAQMQFYTKLIDEVYDNLSDGPGLGMASDGAMLQMSEPPPLAMLSKSRPLKPFHQRRAVTSPAGVAVRAEHIHPVNQTNYLSALPTDLLEVVLRTLVSPAPSLPHLQLHHPHSLEQPSASRSVHRSLTLADATHMGLAAFGSGAAEPHPSSSSLLSHQGASGLSATRGPCQASCSVASVPRTVSSLGIVTHPGLKDAARLGMTCKRLRGAYRSLLLMRPDLSRQAEQNRRALSEKRRLVRRLTLDHHGAYMKREVALELGGGSAVIAGLALACTAWPALRGTLQGFISLAVVTLAYILVHNVILALAYKAAARLGCRRALPLGLAAILVLYCAVVPGLTAVYQARQGLAPGLTGRYCDDSCNSPTSAPEPGPWGQWSWQLATAKAGHQQQPSLLNFLVLPRSLTGHSSSQGAGHGSSPGLSTVFEPPQAGASLLLLAPLLGLSTGWRLIQILTSCFAWVYGVIEYRLCYSHVKGRNMLR